MKTLLHFRKFKQIQKICLALCFTLLGVGCKVVEPEITLYDYFQEVALGAEYADQTEGRISKWAQDIKIFWQGTPHPALQRECKQILSEIRPLIAPLRMIEVNSQAQANLLIFVGSAQTYVEQIERDALPYIQHNRGLFFVYKNEKHEIERGSILVDIAKVSSPKAQKHLLREELTQALGLMNDSPRIPQSIFYEDWTETNRYHPWDRALIRLLYQEDLEAGWSQAQVQKFLNSIE